MPRSVPIKFRSQLAASLSAVVLLLFASIAHAGWVKSEFVSNGKPVEEYHCVPSGKGPFPAIVLLHGATPVKGRNNQPMERICTDLAAQGYYTDYVEYYSQTPAVGPGQPAKFREYFPVWLAEIKAGIDALGKNPDVDPHRIGMMGFSLGAFLSLSTGALESDQIAAIVEYYGGLPRRLRDQAKSMPPTLILHGDSDSLVPVTQAHELDALLTKENRPHEMHIYPGANHAFNFPGLPTWYNPEDAKDAWDRSLKFLGANLKNEGAKGTTTAGGAS